MASLPSSLRFKRPATKHGLNYTKLSTVADFGGLERTSTRNEGTPAVPDFLAASYITASSRSPSGQSNASSTRNTPRRYSVLPFLGTTKHAQTGAPIGDTAVASLEPVKSRPQGRHARILRLFGLHPAQEEPVVCVPAPLCAGSAQVISPPLNDSNDFLAPGRKIADEDRMILDRLDMTVLEEDLVLEEYPVPEEY